MKIQNIIAGLVVSAALLTACTKTEYNAIPVSQLLGDSLPTTISIHKLDSLYNTSLDVYTDTLNKNAGLFTVRLIPEDTTYMVINGVITSSDVEGNIYKYIVIQELGKDGQAIKISIDAGSLSGIWPVGQKVSVKLNGLYLGKYAQSFQIGTRFVNLDKIKLDTLHHKNIYRIEPGRIPLPIAMQAIHAYGMPNANLIKTDTMTIAQIRQSGMSMVNKLVCIKNAYFTGRGADYGLPATIIKDADYIFAPSTGGIGYPQSREIQDGSGFSIFISTSEYSKFATYKLPTSNYRGNITSIVGWYNDKDVPFSQSKIYYQLTMRGLFDLGKGFEGYHQEINK